MKKIVFDLTVPFLLALTLGPPAFGQCQSESGIAMGIAHFPPQPSIQDSVAIEVSGYFPDGCWGCARNENFEIGCLGTEVLDSFGVSGGSIYVYSSARDGWMPGFACPLVIVPYQFRIMVGPLPAGNYTVVSLMETNSLREPLGVACSSGFSVAGASPCVFSRGDMNNDAAYTAADISMLLGCVFTGSGNCHTCFTDVNCDGELRPADVVLEMNKVFLNHAFPC